MHMKAPCALSMIGLLACSGVTRRIDAHEVAGCYAVTASEWHWSSATTPRQFSSPAPLPSQVAFEPLSDDTARGGPVGLFRAFVRVPSDSFWVSPRWEWAYWRMPRPDTVVAGFANRFGGVRFVLVRRGPDLGGVAATFSDNLGEPYDSALVTLHALDCPP